jgi:hypothetical protein
MGDQCLITDWHLKIEEGDWLSISILLDVSASETSVQGMVYLVITKYKVTAGKFKEYLSVISGYDADNNERLVSV